MTGIVKFLHARLDEDERAAYLASQYSGVSGSGTAERWEVVRVGEEKRALLIQTRYGALVPKPVVRFDSALFQRSRADFIARHDPARVLADVAARRRLLNLHKPVVSSPDGPERPVKVCWECGPAEHVLLSPGAAGGDWYPCDTVRLLALPHVDHPHYDVAWRL